MYKPHMSSAIVLAVGSIATIRALDSVPVSCIMETSVLFHNINMGEFLPTNITQNILGLDA